MVNYLIIYCLVSDSAEDIFNLDYFINYGLNTKIWYNNSEINIGDVYVIINNDTIIDNNYIESIKSNNINIINYDNHDNDNDDKNNKFDVYLKTINKLNNSCDFFNKYSDIILLNSNLIGPIYEFGLNRHWTDKINDKEYLKSTDENFIKFKSKYINEFNNNGFHNIVSNIKEIDNIYFRKNYLPEKFDWNIYLSLNPHIAINYSDKYKSIYHYIKHGKKENLKYYNEYKSYPYLFHKYLLHISSPNDKIEYNIINEKKNDEFIHNKLWACLYCYDINKFTEFYGEYIENITKYFSVIVTYSIGEIIPNINANIIKIPNKGRDIGAMLISFDFLYKNNIQFSHILFLHSKTDKQKRKIYFDPFVSSLKQINYICSIIGKYDLIINDLLLTYDWNKSDYYTLNKIYYDDFNKLMNFKHKTAYNNEGNCLIISRKIIDNIFKDNLNKFYNILNTNNSFDYNWVNIYYKLNDNSIQNVYKKYLKQNYIPNSFNFTNRPLVCSYEDILNVNVDISNKNLADCCIEHLFERIWFNSVINLNGKYKIIKKDSIMKDNKLDYNFDCSLYNLIYKNTDNSIENIEYIKNTIYSNNNSNIIYSCKQILELLPLNFDINNYSNKNNITNYNKYEIINHYINNKVNKNKKDIKWIDIQSKKNDIKTFVYVFPQFHEIPENNLFWGNGFTEWWNVKKTYQLNDKHIPLHPHHDIGYYNLLDYNVRKRYNDYADNFGFFGYIYCHFWFSNGIIMNKPLDMILEDGQPDKPWFLNWINENWTKRWDGGNNSILLNVDLDVSKCDHHFNELLKYFKHNKYYKVDNKPFLGIYRIKEIPEIYINRLVELSILNGFNGLVFLETLNNKIPFEENKIINNKDYCEYKFEYPPNYSGTLVDAKINNNNLKFNIDNNFLCYKNFYDINLHYTALINTKTNKTIRGIMPCWDNFPRHASNLESNSYTFINFNSLLFYFTIVKQFLLIKKENINNDDKYFFINALNEWGEQCVLEPTIQTEYSFLEAFKLAKETDLEKVNEKLLNKLICHF